MPLPSNIRNNESSKHNCAANKSFDKEVLLHPRPLHHRGEAIARTIINSRNLIAHHRHRARPHHHHTRIAPAAHPSLKHPSNPTRPPTYHRHNGQARRSHGRGVRPRTRGPSRRGRMGHRLRYALCIPISLYTSPPPTELLTSPKNPTSNPNPPSSPTRPCTSASPL